MKIIIFSYFAVLFVSASVELCVGLNFKKKSQKKVFLNAWDAWETVSRCETHAQCVRVVDSPGICCGQSEWCKCKYTVIYL